MSVISDQLYPFATQDGKAIPLDIIRPQGLIQVPFTLTWASLVIPAGYEICVFRATEDAIIDISGTAAVANVDGTAYNNHLFIPKGYIVTAAITVGTVKIIGASAVGRLVIQALKKWSSLSLPRQSATITS